MQKVDARAVTTEMIHLQTSGNRPLELLPEPPMGADLATIDDKHAIARGT
jgi:hypothetical protein